MKYKLKVIIGSTRPSRKGPIVADWFLKIAKQHPDFEVELLDLKEINLPFMDELEHPRAQKYANAHTKKWSKTIDNADAFVIVTPEYNFGYPASLKNALDYLSIEWADKPMGFVSYGGVSAGTRAVQELKLPVTTLGMMPLPQAVNIPFFTKFINENNVFEANEPLDKSANVMLNKLQAWAKALKGMREENN
ncbi:NAD(P)H-dependent FMN reductase [Salegentibacter echinorum]|uniref:NAD(P)H-dependent FMN reductase n=1 Tax=Salegentibacter echinorum TaxID=1073325 RepID=A0A1M5BRA2_SALEC|nr:NAD(P)H-dependent oxidoreductase [Salegentibacter echinorum]SHF45059.1 NAD(P)H-dependent FMN reductase [Salegentibacter echinorum]